MDQLLKVLSAGASYLSMSAPLCGAVLALFESCSLHCERSAVCGFYHHAGAAWCLLVRGL